MGSVMSEPFSYFRLEPYVKPASPAFEARMGIRRSSAGLDLVYELRGDLDTLRIPAPGESIGELWAHTCFELFARATSGGEGAYWEWNFSPTLRTNFFAFDAYRERRSPFHPGDRGVRTLRFERPQPQLLVARVEIASPPSEMLRWLFATRASMSFAATMVLESRAGEIQYWATRHSGAKPDFHRAEDMIISL